MEFLGQEFEQILFEFQAGIRSGEDIHQFGDAEKRTAQVARRVVGFLIKFHEFHQQHFRYCEDILVVIVGGVLVTHLDDLIKFFGHFPRLGIAKITTVGVGSDDFCDEFAIFLSDVDALVLFSKVEFKFLAEGLVRSGVFCHEATQFRQVDFFQQGSQREFLGFLGGGLGLVLLDSLANFVQHRHHVLAHHSVVRAVAIVRYYLTPFQRDFDLVGFGAVHLGFPEVVFAFFKVSDRAVVEIAASTLDNFGAYFFFKVIEREHGKRFGVGFRETRNYQLPPNHGQISATFFANALSNASRCSIVL